VVTEAAAAELSLVEWSLRPIELTDLRGIEGPVGAFVAEPRTDPI
jgi:hypothetical protein